MDLNKIKQKLQDLDSKGGGVSAHMWRPTVGTHTIRMVPYLYNKDWPFIELYFYYKLKKGTVISPISFGKPDPVQEFVDELKSTGDKEDWKTAINLQAKQRVYIPILIRGKEDEGVKFWAFGKQIYQELLRVVDDPDYGDISHLKTGRDITVEVTQVAGKQWPDITIRMKPNTTDASKDRSVLERLKEMPDLATLWKEPTYQELKVMLEKYLSNEDELVTQEQQTPVSNTDFDPFDNPDPIDYDNLTADTNIDPNIKKSSEKKPVKTPVKAAAVDSEFDDLFNS